MLQPDGTMRSILGISKMANLASVISQNGNALNITEIGRVAQQALTKASAETTATGAAAAAAAAQATADGAVTIATAAQSIASQAFTAATNPQLLIATKNLSDIPNDPLARTNLGVNLIAVTVTYDTLPASLPRYIPITQPTTVPAGFAGTVTYCGVTPTTDATFTVRVIRAGAPILIGYITLIHLGHAASFSNQAAFKLVAGDVLQITCPSPADTSLANVGITLSLALT